jgi:hypothetical protein
VKVTLPPAQEKPKTTHEYSLRLPTALYDKIEAAKWARRKSVNSLIVEALEKVDWK